MAAGLAVVSSLTGEAANLISREGCGISYRPGDVRGLTGALLAVSEPHVLASVMGRSRSAFLRQFDSSVCYERFVDILESVAQARR
jgi:glycosyltransferase involved in cell wall biosynthesis